jgi:hypothetical protein
MYLNIRDGEGKMIDYVSLRVIGAAGSLNLNLRCQMTMEESGSVILDIFRKECAKPGDALSNKVVHDAYFKKTDSGLGFFEGVRWLVKHRWLAEKEGEVNTYEITKAGWKADI